MVSISEHTAEHVQHLPHACMHTASWHGRHGLYPEIGGSACLECLYSLSVNSTYGDLLHVPRGHRGITHLLTTYSKNVSISWAQCTCLALISSVTQFSGLMVDWINCRHFSWRTATSSLLAAS
jgi:hypothetical protein